MGKITVSQLGKAYKQYPTRWSRLREWLTPGNRKLHGQKWVLQDINFEVESGEAIGIIGINGAGKSTLLKLITGTAQATTGSVCMTGRVAALLELGMGFHPDFTGYQNVFMAGQLLGLRAEEIACLMPEIEAFAEIGDYINQPVRVYSSGMQVRLAFSVATAIRPDILIIDEALSVGDAYFQHKSIERIRGFREQGTTLLLVSHDKQAIVSMCDRAILLNAGSVAMEGAPESVMDFYNALLAERQNQNVQQVALSDGKIQTTSGTYEAVVAKIALVDQSSGAFLETVNVGQAVRLQIEVVVNEDIERLVLGYGIKDRFGQIVFGSNTHYGEQPLHNLKAGQRLLYEVDFLANLGLGSYSIQTALHDTESHLGRNFEWKDLALVFHMVNMTKQFFVGCNWLEHTVRVKEI